MAESSQLIGELMRRRIKIIGELSQATCEHQRTLQMKCGIEVDLQKNPSSTESLQRKSEISRKIAAVTLRTLELEAEMAQVDLEIERVLKEEE